MKMLWTTYNDDGTTTEIPCEVVAGSEFYEPGDPVPGCSIRFADGRVRGSIDMRDLSPAPDADAASADEGADYDNWDELAQDQCESALYWHGRS